MTFFQNLNFSSSNEDGETELAALSGASRIVCLTGSGARALDMLLSGADEVIALDINPAQNALLRLKVAAITCLDHAELLSFLGITPASGRRQFYDKLKTALSPEMRSYWDKNLRTIESGVWYAGKWERVLQWNAIFLNLFRGKAIRALMEADSVAGQADVWRRKFRDGALRSVIEMAGRRWIWTWVMREPAGNYLPGPRQVAQRLAESFERASQNYLFRTSDFATLVLLGRLRAETALPVHLNASNYPLLRQRLSRLRIVQGGLSDLGALGVSQVDGFSLSDFGSYCAADGYAACWRGILAVAAPQAKFCERVFMNDLDFPFASIQEDPSLSAKLTQSDKAVIYRVRAGTLA